MNQTHKYIVINNVIRKVFVVVLIVVVFSVLPCSALAEDKLPSDVVLVMGRVNILIHNNKIGKAVLVLKEYAEKHENQGSHYYIDFLMGNCFLMLDQADKQSSGKKNFQPGTGNLKKAACAYTSAVKKKPDFSSAWLNLAKCRYDLGQNSKAAYAFIKGYETADREKGENRAVYLYYASMCHTFTKDYQKALAVFKRLLKMHPDEIKPEWKETLVNILFSLEKYREALLYIEQLTRDFKGKKQKKWQKILLYQYISLNMDQKALGYAKYLTKIDPLESMWWKALTHVHLNMDHVDQGLCSLIVYSYIKPLTQEEISLMADLYLASNIPVKAVQYYEKWLNNESDKKNIFEKIKKLINASLASFQNQKALYWIEKGLVLKNDSDLVLIKADLLFEAKKYKAAFNAYKKLSKFKKYKGQALLMMGYAAWNEDRFDDAENCFKKAIKFKKQKKAALMALKSIEQRVKIR